MWLGPAAGWPVMLNNDGRLLMTGAKEDWIMDTGNPSNPPATVLNYDYGESAMGLINSGDVLDARTGITGAGTDLHTYNRNGRGRAGHRYGRISPIHFRAMFGLSFMIRMWRRSV